MASPQVSCAAKLPDDALAAWRNRPLSEIKYLILDARYEKMRHGGIVRDAAVLLAIGIGPDERRRVLGAQMSIAGCLASVWPCRKPRCIGAPSSRASKLAACEASNTLYLTIMPDCGPRAGRSSAGPHGSVAMWPRPKRHPSRAELREIWNAASLAKAETSLAELVTDYRGTAPKLAAWLEENSPEGLTVFTLPKHHRRCMRITNPMERSVQQELKLPPLPSLLSRPSR